MFNENSHPNQKASKKQIKHRRSSFLPLNQTLNISTRESSHCGNLTFLMSSDIEDEEKEQEMVDEMSFAPDKNQQDAPRLSFLNKKTFNAELEEEK